MLPNVFLLFQAEYKVLYTTVFCSSAEGMKAGNYGNLLVQIEQPRGEYAVTIAFLRLITTLVKVETVFTKLNVNSC